jgi:hypothetical protein
VDVVDVREDAGHELQSTRSDRQVDLGDVSRDDHARPEAEAREEHLHLLGRGVLRLVEHDEGVVEGAAAHVRERRDLDRARGQELRNDFGVEHLVQCVIERSKVRVDLVGQRSRQVAQSLAGLDRRTSEDDAVDLFPLQGLHGLGHRQVGLARSCRSDAEDDGIEVDRVDVGLLAGRLRADALAPCREDRLPERVDRAGRLVGVEDRSARSHFGRCQILSVPDHHKEFIDEAPCGLHLVGVTACEGDFVSPHVHVDTGVLLFDSGEEPVLGTEQAHHGDAVDVKPCLTGHCALNLRQGNPLRGHRRERARARGTPSARRTRPC